MSEFGFCPFASSRFSKNLQTISAALYEPLFSDPFRATVFDGIIFENISSFEKNMGRILDHLEQGHQALNSKCKKVNLRRYNFTSVMMIKCKWFSAVYGLTGLKLLCYAKIYIENMLQTMILWFFFEVFASVTWESWLGDSKNSWVGVQVYMFVTAPHVTTVTVLNLFKNRFRIL